MTFNSRQFNADTYNSGVVSTASGIIAGIEQDVARFASGVFCNIEQVLELRSTGGGGLFASVDQSVSSVAGGIFAQVGQRVELAGEIPIYVRRKYGITAFLGGLQIDTDQPHGALTISFEEGAASQCSLTLFKGEGVEDVEQYFGVSLIVNGTKPDGTYYRMFTGIVDEVETNPLTLKTVLLATDRRKELLEAITSPLSRFGSGYDVSLLINSNASNTQIIEGLLEYKPYALDFDAYNNFVYVPWEPKASADFTITDNEFYRRDPDIELVRRGTIINQVDIQVDYRFNRLQYMRITQNWSTPYGSTGINFGNALKFGYSFTPREMVLQALSGTGWVVSDVSFSPMPPPGWYAPTSSVGGLTDGRIGWPGDVQKVVTVADRDINGNTISDSSGNTVYSTRSTNTYATSGVHCSAASWRLSKRWVQPAVKRYSLSVSSATSQSKFGVVNRVEQHSFTDSYDTSRWDDFSKYAGSFDVQDGTGTVLSLGSSQTYEPTPSQSKVFENTKALIAKARTAIISSHRENYITFTTKFMPEIQLHHTIELATDRIATKGKVKSYRHFINLSDSESYTEIEIAFFNLGSGGSDSAYTLPTVTTSNPVSFPSSRNFDSAYGLDPSSTDAPGYYGNAWKRGDFYRTNFTEQLRIDTPAISGLLVDTIVFAVSGSYSVAIPSSTLTITYKK